MYILTWRYVECLIVFLPLLTSFQNNELILWHPAKVTHEVSLSFLFFRVHCCWCSLSHLWPLGGASSRLLSPDMTPSLVASSCFLDNKMFRTHLYIFCFRLRISHFFEKPESCWWEVVSPGCSVTLSSHNSQACQNYDMATKKYIFVCFLF